MMTLDYLPIKRTAAEELLYLEMLDKVEQIKKEMGNKYLLANPYTKPGVDYEYR